MRKCGLVLALIISVLIIVVANLVTDYAMRVSSLQTYGMAKFNVQLTVICTGVIVFFVEKNGLQTRKKIQEEFDELHERLHKEKQEKEQQTGGKLTFVHQEETQQPEQ